MNQFPTTKELEQFCREHGFLYHAHLLELLVAMRINADDISSSEYPLPESANDFG